MLIKCKGISLPELMVALFISSLLVLFALQFFLMQHNHFVKNSSMLADYYEFNLLTQLLRDRVFHAGFTPCRSISQLKGLDTRFSNHPLREFTVGAGKEVLLEMSRMDDEFVTLKHMMRGLTLDLPQQLTVRKQDNVVIADCRHAEVHSLQTVQTYARGVRLVLNRPLQFDYLPPVYIGRWLEERLIVEKNGQDKMVLYLDSGQKLKISQAVRRLLVQELGNSRQKFLLASLNMSRRNKPMFQLLRRRNP